MIPQEQGDSSICMVAEPERAPEATDEDVCALPAQDTVGGSDMSIL